MSSFEQFARKKLRKKLGREPSAKEIDEYRIKLYLARDRRERKDK